MSESHVRSNRSSRDLAVFWRKVVCPSARGLEGFGWRVAWFVVLIKVLFYLL